MYFFCINLQIHKLDYFSAAQLPPAATFPQKLVLTDVLDDHVELQ